MIKSSIVIPTYNRLIYTQICLQFLELMVGQRPDIEVVIVDNGSSDGTREFLDQLGQPFTRVLHDRNFGFAAGCNRGANVAKGENLIFLNNDTVPLPGWLDPLETLLDNPSVGIVGSKLLFPDDTIQHAGVAISAERYPVPLYYLFPSSYPGANVERDYQAVTGACLGIRKALFFELGGFDEGYQNSFEDVDLCLRARAQKCRVVYCPRSVLYHFESVSEGRHLHDEINLARLWERWRDSLLTDEREIYRLDGFAEAPRLHARSLPQAIAQIESERRRADALQRALAAAEQSTSDQSSIWPGVTAVIPHPVEAGITLPTAIYAKDAGAHLAGHSTLRYSWVIPWTNVTVWRGAIEHTADSLGRGVARHCDLLIPSIPGKYELTWSVGEASEDQTVGRQDVVVSPAYGFDCQVRLPGRMRARQRYRVDVYLKNRGARSWLAHGEFKLSYHWFDESGRWSIEWDGDRTPLFERVACGDDVIVRASLITPPLAGRYQLAWDMIHEGVLWFSSSGAEGPRTVVEVEPDLDRDGLEYRLSSTLFPVGDGTRTGVQRREHDHADLVTIIQKQQLALQIAKQEQEDREQALAGLDVVLKDREQALINRDRDIGALKSHLDAVSRGRVLRALNWLTAWRRKIVSPS